MGTDISLYVEVKRDGRWEAADQWEHRFGRFWEVPYDKRYYSGRNYRLFAVLADVRNSWDIPPVHLDNRGLPADMSEQLKLFQWGDIGYYHQDWCTLRELQEYPWDLEVCFQGMFMLREDAKKYRETRELPEYSWKTPNDIQFDLTQYDAVDVYVSVGWLCRSFVDEVMPRLAQLGEPDDVRIVYGFD